jgi:hypothetical protein
LRRLRIVARRQNHAVGNWMAEDFAGSGAAFGAALSADGGRKRDEEKGEGDEPMTAERKSRSLTAIRRRRGWVPFDCAQGQRDDIKAKTRQSGDWRSQGATHSEELPPGSASTRGTQGTIPRRGLRRWRTRWRLLPSTRARTRFECQASPDAADKCLFPA